MSEINVLVASISPDMKATGIAAAVAKRSDMTLVGGRCVEVEQVDALLEIIDPSTRCALVLEGHSEETRRLTHQWLKIREDLVVMYVEVVGDVVQIGLRDPTLDSILAALRELVEGAVRQGPERVTRMPLREVKSPPEDSTQLPPVSIEYNLLEASIKWVHALLRDAVQDVPEENGDVNGFSVTRKTLLESLDATSKLVRDNQISDLPAADAALKKALESVETNPEPLAVACREFGLCDRQFRLMVLTLAPELDIRFQRCMGFLLDEIGRRVGTMGLYCSLLGITPQVRGQLIDGGPLARWAVFEGYAGRPAAADEPLRLDPFFAEWLLGDSKALKFDPRVRRVLRLMRWPGASILKSEESRAEKLMEKILDPSAASWLLFDGDDSVSWRALLELGAKSKSVRPIRIETTRLTGLDPIEVEECARRVGRMARLTGDPLIIDVTSSEKAGAEDDYLRLFLASLNRTHCKVAVVCSEEARIVRLLGKASFELVDEEPLPKAARVEAVRAAAKGADAYLTQELAESIANRYPLHVDGLEHAQRLAASRPKTSDTYDPALERLTAAFKELASEGISHLVERIEPVFSLEEVVLPPDRKQQLNDIVDHVRLAPRVLDGWKFRDQLPYGRGVAALFSGSSGTGKTMAAMGIARQLGIQILRLDLSRVVNKYIGETEKNIDRVFTDAQGSGAAILIDEADALLGKRSEVKDAHDRYANIEVAYLLQRIEAYEGLAILTTNLRRNLDSAFLRRLRFIVEFPRPDAEAREQIWRQCLPAESHELNDAAFRQLGRRIELTGGQIRQITLRAAFIAAAAEKLINLEHIAQAASAELAKLGMPPIELELIQPRRAAA